MGALDPAKILVILVIALVVLGPERLPKVARQMGAVWRELSKIRDQVTEEVRSAIPLDDLPRIPRPTPGSISGFVSGLTSPSPSPSRSPMGHKGGLSAPEVSETSPVEEIPSVGGGAEGSSPTLIVVHPELGEFAFVPDDPSMN